MLCYIFRFEGETINLAGLNYDYLEVGHVFQVIGGFQLDLDLQFESYF